MSILNDLGHRVPVLLRSILRGETIAILLLKRCAYYLWKAGMFSGGEQKLLATLLLG